MDADQLLKKLDRLLQEVKARVRPSRLPYVVKRFPFSDLPLPLLWRKLEKEKGKLEDMPGHEQANQEAEAYAQENRIIPKLYLFDPDREIEEGIEEERQERAEQGITFEEWEGPGLYPGRDTSRE